MQHAYPKNRLIGIIAIVFGLSCLASLALIDRSKMIILVSSFFLVRYFPTICLIDGALYFVVVGILGFVGTLAPGYGEPTQNYKRTKAKGVLISAVILTPFLLSLFSTIFTMSKTPLWKILGSMALAYFLWLLFSSTRALRKSKRNGNGVTS